MKTTLKVMIGAVAGFVVGCAAGLYSGSLQTSEGTGAGNIAKVSKYNRNVVSPAMSAFQEKVISNPEELKKAAASLAVLTSRMVEFDELVKIATLASEGNEALAEAVENLQKVRKLAENARNNGKEALDALNSAVAGEQTDIDYEQASQNLSLAFMMVDRQVSLGKQYVCEVDDFLKHNGSDDNKELAIARDLWAGYCAGEAVLTNDKDEMAFWRSQENVLPEGSIASLSNFEFESASPLANFSFDSVLECCTVDGMCAALLGAVSRDGVMPQTKDYVVLAGAADAACIQNIACPGVISNVQEFGSALCSAFGMPELAAVVNGESISNIVDIESVSNSGAGRLQNGATREGALANVGVSGETIRNGNAAGEMMGNSADGLLGNAADGLLGVSFVEKMMCNSSPSMMQNMGAVGEVSFR